VSVPQPWPRRRPVLPLVLGIVGLLDVVVALLGIAQDGSSSLQRGIVALWLAVVVLCAGGWRRQVRRFDEETARLERSEGAGEAPDAVPPSP
jgi:hypothetical protein